MADHYQRIAEAALGACLSRPKKLLLYSEIEDGVSSADLFFQLTGENVVHFRFAPAALRELVVGLWEQGDGTVSPRSWTALSFVVADGRFSVDFAYPDQVSTDEDLSDRRPRAVEACFPGKAVDYSRPRG